MEAAAEAASDATTFVSAWFLSTIGTGGHDSIVGDPYDSLQACTAAGNAMFHGAGGAMFR